MQFCINQKYTHISRNIVEAETPNKKFLKIYQEHLLNIFCLFTDGSKKSENSSADYAVVSKNGEMSLKRKVLELATSFSLEAMTILEIIILIATAVCSAETSLLNGIPRQKCTHYA